MRHITYIREKLDQFAVDSGLEFRMYWSRNIQRWIIRFVNRKFRLGCDLCLSDKEISVTNTDHIVEWIILEVKKSGVIVF